MSSSNLPQFNDTAQAFQHLTDAELRRAVALFSLIGKTWLVNAGSALAHLALALRVPLAWAVKPTVYAHFCGGESIEDSEETMAKLAAHNVRTILDYSAEGQTAESDLDATCSEVLATIHAAAGDARHAFAVFKVSGLSSNALLEKVGKAMAGGTALDREDEAAWERVQRRVRTLCEATAAAGGRVMIDAEESWIQDAIDALAEDMMSDYNRDRVVVYNTVQMYRHDRLAYLEAMAARAEEGGYNCVGSSWCAGHTWRRNASVRHSRATPRRFSPTKPPQTGILMPRSSGSWSELKRFISWLEATTRRAT